MKELILALIPLIVIIVTIATLVICRYIANGTLRGGGLWMLTVLITMLSDFHPDLIYPGIAVSVLPLFYSLMLSVFLFHPIAYRFEQAGACEKC